MSNYIITEQFDRVLLISMNRKAQLNALSHAMYQKMGDDIAAANLDDNIRAIIITGIGDAFTAGNDLDDFAKPMPKGKTPVIHFLENLRDATKPVFAAVNGAAVGIGLTMLLHCDFVYASEDAQFSAPFAHVGLVPEAASSLLLPSLLGQAWANDVLIAGRVLTAGEALHHGLVSRLFPQEKLMAETLSIAKEVASLAPNAVKNSKALIRSRRDQVVAQMNLETPYFAAQLKSEEFPESVKAFLSGAPRQFTKCIRSN